MSCHVGKFSKDRRAALRVDRHALIGIANGIAIGLALWAVVFWWFLG
jgi:hypothetical protein